jgi:hypothetical protein
MRIAIVANGSSLIESKKGKEIDDHDLVVRMCWFFYNMSENITGLRTDVWATPFDVYPAGHRYEYFPVDTIWLTRPRSWDNDIKWSIPKWADELIKWEMDSGFFGEIDGLNKKFGGTNPTTGFITTQIVNKLYPESEVDLYGYDFYSPMAYYYNTSTIKWCVENTIIHVQKKKQLKIL